MLFLCLTFVCDNVGGESDEYISAFFAWCVSACEVEGVCSLARPLPELTHTP